MLVHVRSSTDNLSDSRLVAVLLAGVAVGAVLAVVALKAAPLLTSKQPTGVRTPRIIRTAP